MHIVQRGNNKQPCFLQERDYLVYHDALAEYSERYRVEVHAYVLMTNHVHLLVTPSDGIGPSRMMQQLGRRYVLSFNKRYQRSGTLWEGRFHSSIIDADDYLFACYRYIELNPVRAAMVGAPGEYGWSSYRVNAHGAKSCLITPHQQWIDLGINGPERCSRYRKIVGLEWTEHEVEAIRFGTNKGLPIGPKRFRERLELKLDVKFGSGIPGRPRI